MCHCQGPLVTEVIAWGIGNRALQRVATAAILLQTVALYLATLAGVCERALAALGVPVLDSEVRTVSAPALHPSLVLARRFLCRRGDAYSSSTRLHNL